MRKLFVLLTMSLLVVTASAQKLSWPPKSYPVKVPFTVSEEVKYYWDVQGVLCTGRGNGGYKFRILGTANHDFTASRSINFYYISTGNKTTVAGAYYFPKVKAGQKFSFEIVSAFSGYTPAGFNGFYIHDELLRIPKEEVALKREETSTLPAVANQVDGRNVLAVMINMAGEVMAGDDYIGNLGQLTEKVKEFVANPYNDENLPEKQKKRIPYFDEIMVTSNHKVTVSRDAKTTEANHQAVMAAIRAAYKELRGELANEKFGKDFSKCSYQEQKAISQVYPQNIEDLGIRNFSSGNSSVPPPPETLAIVEDKPVEIKYVPVQIEVDSDKIYDDAEEMPSFPGGQVALMRFLSSNMKYPKEEQESGTQGRVVVQFVVGRDGSICDAKVTRSVSPALDQEALRIVSVMPRWKPGMKGGKAVRVQYTMPLMFRLQ